MFATNGTERDLVAAVYKLFARKRSEETETGIKTMLPGRKQHFKAGQTRSQDLKRLV